ncbi:MAG: ferritin-like domain-containing protein [Pseudomonadota bacterium]|nr:ferritin-like domain-containing protein [Pseudomonadota bacterium]
MAGASEGLHEDPSKLSAETIDRHRAIVSLMEELEAVDWYQQRVDACSDPALRDILAHNRDEEIEHAAMTLEWLRRNVPAFAAQLESNLFKDGPIVGDHGDDGQAEAPAAAPADGSLGIGSLRG